MSSYLRLRPTGSLNLVRLAGIMYLKLDSISVFWIFKHFRTWNLTHTVAMGNTVFIRYDDTLKVNGHDERCVREVCRVTRRGR